MMFIVASLPVCKDDGISLIGVDDDEESDVLEELLDSTEVTGPIACRAAMMLMFRFSSRSSARATRARFCVVDPMGAALMARDTSSSTSCIMSVLPSSWIRLFVRALCSVMLDHQAATASIGERTAGGGDDMLRKFAEEQARYNRAHSPGAFPSTFFLPFTDLGW